MIKPDMIPDDVVVALRSALDRSEYLDAAIATALNAWPDVVDTHPNNIGHLVLQFKKVSDA